MLKNIFYGLVGCILVLTVYNCAQPGSLSGGPVDKTPPKLNKEESSKSFQTNFEKQDIKLVFDEWLVLDNAFTQVVVSPPLLKPPKVSLKGKTVTFRFDEEEVLKKDATYTINFGEAIKDLNEKNVVKNLRFLFSTGDYIDSLEVNGKVIDAFTGKPVEDVLLMLYDNLSDTIVRKERPFYFAKTNQSGQFKIENVKSDTFKVFGLKDENFNYLFDLESELIAFQEEPIILSDSTQPVIELQLFQEEVSMRMIKKDSTTYGKLKLIFNKKPMDVQLTTNEAAKNTYFQYQQDSIFAWYDLMEENLGYLYIQTDTLLDTVRLPIAKRDEFLAKAKLYSTNSQDGREKKLNPFKSAQIFFNQPLSTFDTSLIQIFPDSLETSISILPKIDSVEQNQLHFTYKWQAQSKYRFLLLPGAVTDIFGLTNPDSIVARYEVVAKDDFGNITLNVENIDTAQSYLLQLFFKKDNLVEEFSVAGDSVYQKVFNALPAGNYSLRIIEDRNGNQRWDPGNYDRKEQPERLISQELEELRPGWDLEAPVSLEKFRN